MTDTAHTITALVLVWTLALCLIVVSAFFQPEKASANLYLDQWKPIAKVTVYRSNASSRHTSIESYLTKHDREVINILVRLYSPGTTFTLYKSTEPIMLPWSFAGHSGRWNAREFLYGWFVEDDNGERTSGGVLMDGSIIISEWQEREPKE